MGDITEAFKVTFADGPSSDPYHVDKAAARRLGPTIETQVTGAAAGLVRSVSFAGLGSGTRAGQPGQVTTGADQGEYYWNGTIWVRTGDLVDTAGLQEDIDTLSDDLADEAEARLQVRIDADTNIQAERVARQAGDLSLAASAPVAFRPGEAGQFFVDRLDGGLPAFVAGLSSGSVVTNAEGYALRIAGAGLIGNRSLVAVESGRFFRIAVAVRRNANPNDPSNDTVRVAIAWYSATMGRLASPVSTVIEDLNDLTTGSGRVEVSAILSETAGDGVDIVAPAGAVYFRPYVQTYGVGGSTDIEFLRATDITDAQIIAPDVDAVTARVAALESIDSGDRLDDLEPTVAALEAASPLIDQLPQRSLTGAAWRGGFATALPMAPRIPEVADFRKVQTGQFGDGTLLAFVRHHGAPVEAELFDSTYLDAQLAASTLLSTIAPAKIIFGNPTYFMDGAIPYDLVRDVILVSHSPGVDGPPTMLFENPAHTPFSFTAGRNNVRFEGVWKIKHRTKPANNTVRTVNVDGGKNIYFETLVIENAALALRVASGSIWVDHLVTINCDEAISVALAAAGNVHIGKHTAIGTGAHTVTGRQYIDYLDGWRLPWTPTARFEVPGTSSFAYALQSASYEKRGKTVTVNASITFTPTIGTGTGALEIVGLPFISKVGLNSFGLVLASISAITWPGASTQLVPTVAQGQSVVRLVGHKSGAATATLTAADLVSGVPVTIRFSGTYETD